MRRPCRALFIASLVLISVVLTGCEAHGKGGAAAADAAPILLFNGSGTSPNDVRALERILENNHLDYATADSAQLNQMSKAQIRGHRLLIVPGGNFIDMGKGLTSNTATNIRDAVENGVNYLGICGGGFLAGNSAYYNGFNLTSGAKFGFYSAEIQNIRKAAVPISVPGAPALEHYWEDGPQFTGWGAVVGKYPDGTPAIVEGTSGSGWVVLSGVHPEAPESWRRGMMFNIPASVDNEYAAMLIKAALNRISLPHY